MGRTNQRRTVEIDRGLFLVRYASAADHEHPPKVTVRPQKGDQRVAVVLHPDHDEAVMWEPGAFLVIRATEPTTLAVEVEASSPTSSAAASVRIEPIDQGQRPAAAQPDRDGEIFGEVTAVRVLGHVASVGDVIVNGGDWIAGPTAPSRIEGIAIEWPDMPEDIDLQYTVKTATAQSIVGRTTGPGTFAGTRGKALPIVAMVLDLSGSGAADIRLEAEAIFLGSPAVRGVGHQITLSGPTGREPLVGLRINVKRVDATTRRQGVAAPLAARTGHASRVRVFRGRARQDQAAAG
jgi:hypothetical protein